MPVFDVMEYNICMKKIFAIFFIMLYLCTPFACAMEPLKGSVTETDNYRPEQSELFTGKIETLDR